MISKQMSIGVSTPLAITIVEATRMLGISRSTIYRYLTSGRLRAIKAGARTLILMDSAHEFLAACPSYSAP